jgi:catechol 2,3-dioxygenase-like lactoylglutathione lyase family enzyme
VIRDIDLDHVAVATERQADAWPRYVGDLGAEWLAGGDSVGFSSAQVRYANGMKVEVLEPHLVDQNDFLRRFLDASGAGPHHLTFKVADIRGALREVEAAGLQPVGVDLRHDEWQEAFLHPKEAFGVVVQVAQSAGASWESPPPADLPAASPSSPATLDHVAHAVADLDRAQRFFGDLLGGRVEASGTLDGGRYVDLAWPGPGRIRLITPVDGPASEWRTWLDGRPGRVHHLAFTVADPSAVPGAAPSADGAWVVDPHENLGVRLVVRPPA